jgi:hypothetical protein
MKARFRFKAAMAAQLALLFYFELCVFVPLGDWNAQNGKMGPGLTAGNLVLGGAIGGAQLLLLIATVWRIRWLLWIGLLCDSLWLLAHIHGLWFPYFFGASPRYAEMYARVFSNTTKLLPNSGNHLAPDAMHIFIDVFLVATIVTLVSFIRILGKEEGGDRARAASAIR